jgi:hypothetical protein
MAWSGMVPVVSTSSRGAADLAAAGSGAAGAALAVRGAARLPRGGNVQNHTPAMTTAATTLANIKPNALRMVTLSQTRKLKSWSDYLWEVVVNAAPTPCWFPGLIGAPLRGPEGHIPLAAISNEFSNGLVTGSVEEWASE